MNTNTHELDSSNNHKPNYKARRYAAGLALTATGIGGAGFIMHDKWSTGPEPSHPNQVVTVEVKPGDTGIEIGQRLGTDNEGVNKIAEQVQDQAENGMLQPGQEVTVDASLVTDPNAAEYIEANSGQ